MKKPFFVGIGVQKCASTWIYRILEDHPDVSVSSPKEVDFFSNHFDFGFQWYEAHFEEGKVSGENSPSYFCDALAPERVFAYNQKMKIIVCLRDPVERIISQHAHEVRLGHVNADMNFTTALSNNLMYLEQSKYAKYLKRWLSIFADAQVLVLLQEDIQKEPAIVAKRVYKFLSVDSEFTSSFLNRRANISQQPRAHFVAKMLKVAAFSFRYLGLERFVIYIKRLGWVGYLKELNMKDIRRSIPDMTNEELDRIDCELNQDLLELERIVDADLTKWPTWQRLVAKTGLKEECK